MNSTEYKSQEFDKRYLNFVNYILHDTKPMFAVIKGYSDLLLMETNGTLNEFQRESLQKISHHTTKAANCLWEFQSLAYLESGYLVSHQTTLNLTSALKDVIKEYQSTLDTKKQGVKINSPQSQLFVKATEQHLHEIIYKLIEHAHLCLAPGESIEITIASKDAMAYTTISTEFYSADTLVKPYNPRLRKFEIIERFIEQFGGEFGDESEEGKGSTVWFTLPIADEPPEQE